jgi:hypothetical protein
VIISCERVTNHIDKEDKVFVIDSKSLPISK